MKLTKERFGRVGVENRRKRVDYVRFGVKPDSMGMTRPLATALPAAQQAARK